MLVFFLIHILLKWYFYGDLVFENVVSFHKFEKILALCMILNSRIQMVNLEKYNHKNILGCPFATIPAAQKCKPTITRRSHTKRIKYNKRQQDTYL